MAVAAEQSAVAIPELADEPELRRKAARFIGAVAAEAWNAAGDAQEADEALTVKPIESLYDAVQLAYRGDERARRMVDTNAFTDALERTLKSGHIMKVDLMADAAGTIQQHGQSLDSVQANSLRFAADNLPMRRRVEAETRNMFRLQHYYERGMLQDYSFVTFSRAADDMDLAVMRRAGFFTDTMSTAIQVTSAQGGGLVMESAFVAGAAAPGSERHDQRSIETLLRQFGVDAAGMSAAELLDTPLLIHNSLMPDGVVSLVERYDAAAGGTFFGEAKLPRDYLAYREQCAEREKGFRPKVDRIVADLIAEAPSITSRLAAAERLNKISGKYMIELAGEDTSINPDVFGNESAARIEMARWHYEQGNIELAAAELEEAVKTDQSSSCPSALKQSGQSGSETAEGKTDGADESGDCEFISKSCPECGAKNVKTVVKRISKTEKRIQGACGCSKTVKAAR